MTEKELREFAKETAGQYAPDGVRSLCRALLEKDPDVVKVLRMIKTWILGGEIQDIIAEHVKIGWEPYESDYVAYVDKVPEAAQAVAQEIDWDVIEVIEREFHVRLTKTGWEYTDERHSQGDERDGHADHGGPGGLDRAGVAGDPCTTRPVD